MYKRQSPDLSRVRHGIANFFFKTLPYGTLLTFLPTTASFGMRGSKTRFWGAAVLADVYGRGGDGAAKRRQTIVGNPSRVSGKRRALRRGNGLLSTVFVNLRLHVFGLIWVMFAIHVDMAMFQFMH